MIRHADHDCSFHASGYLGCGCLTPMPPQGRPELPIAARASPSPGDRSRGAAGPRSGPCALPCRSHLGAPPPGPDAHGPCPAGDRGDPAPISTPLPGWGGAGRVIGADQPMARLVAAVKHGPPRGAGPAACNGQPAPVSPGSSERGVNATRGETSAMAARSRCRGGPWAELAAGLKPQASTASP